MTNELETLTGVPHNAICFFKADDWWCCVGGDFLNVIESPIGFGQTFDEALSAYKIDMKKHLDRIRE